MIAEKNISREQVISIIRSCDEYFKDAHLENYSEHELMVIQTSIEIEKELKSISLLEQPHTAK